MDTVRGRLAEFARAVEERQQNPIRPTGRTYPVRMGSRTLPMDRAHVEATLRDVCPRGLPYLYHYLHVAMVDIGDFEAACGHFGLRGVLRGITSGEVDAEVRARRGRGEAPSTGYLPLDLAASFSRDEADARIAIVAARIAEAGEMAPRIPAAAPGA